MTTQTTFHDGDTCTAQCRIPQTANHIAATATLGVAVVVERDEIAPFTLMKFRFHEIAEKGLELFRANGMWHARAAY